MKPITKEQIDHRIKELQDKKAELLDKYGIFGGGLYVTAIHEAINRELESLGVKRND